jgi:DNA-binding response OmpR family regulator
MSKILIVEDEELLQDVYQLVLTKHGHDVSVASNGQEGLEVLKSATPELILLDVFMPVMDGREFLQHFRRGTYPGTKIVVYTNLSDTKTKSDMLELGADEFILKASMTPDDLVELVETTLNHNNKES